jgi:tRNA-specific 2-thiouridylase
LRPEAGEGGDIVHLDGRPIGRHRGIVDFTVGQRRGLKVALGEPLYVVGLDAVRRRVVVGPKSALFRRHLRLREVNWLGERDLEAGDEAKVFVKIRSTRPPAAASVKKTGEGILVALDEPDEGISPGQACVFYERPGPGAAVLGGGFIAEASQAAWQELDESRPGAVVAGTG